jgi:hypothetical protein
MSIFEWRHYTAAPGRGEELLRRFEEDTFELFDAHGIEVLMFGVDEADGDHLHYVVPWPDRGAMETTWATFASDERWRALRERTEADGPLIESIERRILAAL